MQDKVVSVFGGSGFLGRYVVQRLARQGALIKVGCREPKEAMHLQPLGNVGQIKVQAVNIRDDVSVRALIEDSNVVINLVGILFETGKQTFHSIHVEGARRIAQIAAEFKVEYLTHISALGAQRNSSSKYAKTKAEGEIAVLAAFPQATILRPSLMFGLEDQFFNRFASLACLSPVFPLIGGGETLFQPVYVGDVAEAVVKTAQGGYLGEILELVGPKIYSFKQLLELILHIIGRHRLLVSVPYPIGYGMGAIGQLLPTPFLTIDQVRLLQSNSTASGKHKILEDMGIQPTHLEVVLPKILARFRQ
jgi:uncharacterized protein YbjT (DUF2867 family)